MTEDSVKAKDRFIGRQLADRYQILSVIGEGGMGLVYKARHILMNRLVAIKIIRSELVSNVTLINRFQQEAMAVSKLHHPNIVTVYDFGVTAEGTPYLVMDYLQGVSLSDLIAAEGGLAVARTMPMFLQAGSALQHAHENGVVHRDFKSSNLMICKGANGIDVVKVVDFGMAKLIRPDEEGCSIQELTQTGEVFGSPLYMSPEQCRGQKLDERSDIYSFACVMYYALTGRPPLLGENVLDTLQKQIHDEPVPPSLRDSSVPTNLDEVILKALRKDPDARYQNMSDLLVDLTAVHSGKERVAVTAQFKRPAMDTPAVPAPAPPVAKKRLLGHNFELNVVFSVLIFIVLCMTAFVSGRAFEVADENQEANMWVDRLQDGDRAREVGKLADAERFYTQAMTEAMKFGKNDPRIAKSLVSLGSTYLEDHQLWRAETSFKRARGILEKCYGQNCPELSSVLQGLSEVYEQEGRMAESKAAHDEAIELLSSGIGHRGSLALRSGKSNKAARD